MKNGKRTEQGQAIVLIALALVALIGLTGLAIDGGNVFSDRRHAQNAADTAAISSALAVARGKSDIQENGKPEWRNIGENIALTNGYNNIDSNSVVVHLCSDTSDGVSCPAPYDGSDGTLNPNEYLHVEIISTVDTFFAPVVGVDQLTNRVEAIARAKPPTEMFDGNAMISTCSSGKATFETNGGPATLVTGGGIFVNSDSDDCAFNINGGAGSFSVPSISVVGEACPAEVGGVTATEGVDPYPAPDYSWLDEMIGCGTAPTNAYTTSGNTLTATTSPTRITGTFPPSGIENIDPGIYCLEGDFRVNNTGAILNGTDVTFVMLSGSITLNGGEVRLHAPLTGDTAGLLFYQPIDNDGPSNNAAISGNAILELSGSIITPGVEVAISGTPGTLIDGQVIGCEISLSGSAGGTVNYDDEKNIDNPPQIELTN